ncbi:MAG: NADP-dependent oxidoreductase [Pseudomonadota bacterium]
MKAIGLFAFGSPERLEVVELAEPEPGPGEVRIRVHAAGVNPTDLLLRSGAHAARFAGRPPPYVPGVDAAGVVEKLGPDPDGRLSIGDSVIAYVVPTGPHGGAYAQKIVVPAASVVAAPKGASFFAAATLLLNATTARLALNALALSRGDTVVVTGASGAVGGYAVELAKGDGLTIIADAGSASDEALVKKLGAGHTVPRGDGFLTGVRAIVPRGAAGLVDGASLDAAAVLAVANGGRMATVRGWTGPADRSIAVYPISSTKEAENTALFEHLARLAEDKALTLRVTEVVPAAEAPAAHRRLEGGGVRGRIVLDFESLP